MLARLAMSPAKRNGGCNDGLRLLCAAGLSRNNSRTLLISLVAPGFVSALLFEQQFQISQRRSVDAQAGEAATLRLAPQVLTRRINWLNSIREWQQEFLGNLTPGEFVNCVMDDLLGRSVFVFTPTGQVMRLSRVS